MVERPLQQLELDEIIQGCRLEAGQPRSQERGYCFELFRRAVEEQEQAAWQAIDEQYRNLLHHWIRDCSPHLPRQEVEKLAPDTWPRFWQALTRPECSFSDRFTHVGAILKYLKQCTLSVFYEYQRRAQRREKLREQLEVDEHPGNGQIISEEELLTRIDQERQIQKVQAWIKTYVTDPHEQRILTLSYEYGLTPAEISERFPQEFPTAQIVRRIKERILKRARRALGGTSGCHFNANGRNGHRQNKNGALDRISDAVSKNGR